jgi:hypothetical protein
MTVIYLPREERVQRERAIRSRASIDARVLYFSPKRDARAFCRVQSNATQRVPIDAKEAAGAAGDSRSVFRALKTSLKFGRSEGDLGMSRIVVTVAMLGLMATIIIWSVKPEVAATFTKVPAEAGRPMISPFEIMIVQGKNVPVEEWRDAF